MPARPGSGPRAHEMRRGLIFRTRHSSHKKSKEISACGNFSTQMRISELAVLVLALINMSSLVPPRRGFGLFPSLSVLFYTQHSRRQARVDTEPLGSSGPGQPGQPGHRAVQGRPSGTESQAWPLSAEHPGAPAPANMRRHPQSYSGPWGSSPPHQGNIISHQNHLWVAHTQAAPGTTA